LSGSIELKHWDISIVDGLGNNVVRNITNNTSDSPEARLHQRANQTAMPTIKEIRELVETLNNEYFSTLCQDAFPRVYQNFADKQSRGQQNRELADHVIRQREIPKLIAAIEEYNSNAYNDFIAKHPEYAPPKSQPSPETVPSPPPVSTQKCDVLVLAANPQGTDPLKLQEEADLILARLRENPLGREYIVQIQHATRAEDLSRYLLQYEPVIVHFAGHGSSTGEILLENNQNQIQPVKPEALANLFATLGQKIECVVLNNCFSLEMADALVKHVSCTIGMSAEIDDRSAVAFTGEFYRGLAFGRGYYRAFELGRAQLQLLNLPDADVPRFNTDDLTLLDIGANVRENLPLRVTRSFIDRGTVTPATLYPLWYGTNRTLVDPNDVSKGYSGERDDRIHYGSCQVAVPKSHKFGSIGSEWWQRLLTSTDDRLKLDRSSLNHLDEAHFLASIKAALGEHEPNERSALVFIHGFNVSFEAAALRAAQIGCDLKVPGIMAFYSWPSQGKLNGYTADEATIEASEKYITEFLLNLAQKSDVSKIHIIAHSMGNRGLLRAMQRILAQVKSSGEVSFGQIFLAAPDVDPDIFQDLANAYSQLAERTTLYVSGKDKALAVSGIIHDRDRVGYFPPIKVFEGIDTVEVSNIDLTWLGHGYFAEASDILHDMKELLSHNTPPTERLRLIETLIETKKYWIIRE
jgi:esterase/lipase superfamily enzyme